MTLSFTNSRIKGAVTNLLNHVDILWRWEHLPETFPYQHLPFQLFFGQKRVTHAHMPLAPPSPFLLCQCDSHTGATGGPQLLRLPVDASSPSTSRCGGSHTPRIVEPAVLYPANTSMTTSAAIAVVVGRFAGRSRVSARDNGKRAEESLRMGASAR